MVKCGVVTCTTRCVTWRIIFFHCMTLCTYPSAIFFYYLCLQFCIIYMMNKTAQFTNCFQLFLIFLICFCFFFFCVICVCCCFIPCKVSNNITGPRIILFLQNVATYFAALEKKRERERERENEK